MEKKILFTVDSNKNIHKLWKNFLMDPPKGFEYFDINNKKIVFNNQKNTKPSLIDKLFEQLYHLKRNLPFFLYLHKNYFERKISKKIDEFEPDLVYCVNGFLYRGEIPWIVDFENPGVFLEYSLSSFKRYKKKINKILSKKNCKGILAYSKISKKNFLENFDREKLSKKVYVLKNVITSQETIKKIDHKGFNILFTGTSNLEDDFYSRGGKEVVEVFLKMFEKYPDIKLIIRCKIPKKEKKKLIGRNIEIHEDVLPQKEFSELFIKSDIYLFPAYRGYALSVLEAMSFGLPIVTSDLLENGEPIENGVNGFKIEPPKLFSPFPLMPYYFFQRNPKYQLDEEYIKRIIEKVEYFYRHRKLLKQISTNNINNIKEHYNINYKNIRLKNIFERSMKT